MSDDNVKTFDVIYYQRKQGEEKQFSHKYSELWRKTENYCPKCGARSVWFNDSSGGDFYVGEQYICVACKVTFYLPDGVRKIVTDSDEQRLTAITEE